MEAPETPPCQDPEDASGGMKFPPSAPGATTGSGMDWIPARLRVILLVMVRGLALSEVDEPRTTWNMWVKAHMERLEVVRCPR